MNNTLVIQIGFTIVLILIAVYVYRIFTSTSSTSLSATGGDLSGVEQKINQILEHQKISGQVSQSAKNAEDSSVNAEEMDRLKSEIYNLRQQLNETEKKVFEMTPAEGAQSDATSMAGVGASSSPEQEEKIKQLNKEVDILKAKLSDYEIIAEDIADLSDLRKENEDLRKKLEGSNSDNLVNKNLNNEGGKASTAEPQMSQSDSQIVTEEVTAEVATADNILPDLTFDEPALGDIKSDPKEET